MLSLILLSIYVLFLIIFLSINKEQFSSTTLPQYIIFIRHGEKSNNKSNSFLNDVGLDRANGLIQWVSQTLPSKFGVKVSNIFVPLPLSNAEDVRPLQTISFAAGVTDIPVHITGYAYENHKAYDKVKEISSKSDKNSIFLFTWEHTCLQQLVKTFPMNNSHVPYWESDDFSTVYILTLNNNKYDLSFDCEDILSGDINICNLHKKYKTQKCKNV